MKELSFYVAHTKEINRKYCGKHMAIVDDKVVASGDDPRKVGKRLKRNILRSSRFLLLCRKKRHWC